MASSTAIRARGVTRRYGSRIALEPTDLELALGEVVVLLGPNGAGKSTLLTVLAGALPPTAGSVERSLTTQEIGWAPQRPALYRRLSARENLVLFARLQGLGDPDSGVDAALAEFALAGDADRPSAQLSVGNQQRLNLALGFLGAPRLLLLDEPTASLDPAQTRALWERVRLARARGAGAVVATHLVHEALEADRVLVLEDGRIVFEGTPAEYHETTP
jgi:ABC-type multidrug transport system ATPase subunit